VAGGFACALIDPIAQNSWLNGHANADAIRFVPVRPRMNFAMDLITPVITTRSSLSGFFLQHLVGSLSALEDVSAD